jgi:hypothetical protein
LLIVDGRKLHKKNTGFNLRTAELALVKKPRCSGATLTEIRADKLRLRI